jgi:hypothetical protein
MPPIGSAETGGSVAICVRQPRVPVVHPPAQEERHDNLDDRRSTDSFDVHGVGWVSVTTKTRPRKGSSVETKIA